MANRELPVVGEWYHCYSRGVDKRDVFVENFDYQRFLNLMFLCNGEKRISQFTLADTSFENIVERFSADRGDKIVDIGVYALMPNHVHFLIRPVIEKGLSLFMQKLFTGYTMYFNQKYDRTGALFSGTYKSKHVSEDSYFKRAAAYILMNPVEIIEPAWKTGGGDIRVISERLKEYPYSSQESFFNARNKHSQAAHITVPLNEYYDRIPSAGAMLQEAQEYYRERASYLG